LWYHTIRQGKEKASPYFGFLLSTKAFWLRVEYALRLVFVSVLPCVLVAHLPRTRGIWVSPGVMVTMAITTTQVTLGRTLLALFDIVRALVLFLPLIELTYAINVARHWAGWGVWFAVICFLIATFTRGLVTKICLFSFTIQMVIHFLTGTTDYMEPLQFVKVCICGVAFGLASAVLPFPRCEVLVAEAHLHEAFHIVSLMFHGVTGSVKCGNMERRMNVVAADDAPHAARPHRGTCATDARGVCCCWTRSVFFGSRLQRIEHETTVLNDLMGSIDAMQEIVTRISESPGSWDGCELLQQFDEAVFPVHTRIAALSESVCYHMSQIGNKVVDERSGVEAGS